MPTLPANAQTMTVPHLLHIVHFREAYEYPSWFTVRLHNGILNYGWNEDFGGNTEFPFMELHRFDAATIEFIPIRDGEILLINPVLHPWLIIQNSCLRNEECPSIWEYIRSLLNARFMIAHSIQSHYIIENDIDVNHDLVESYIPARAMVGGHEEEQMVDMEEEIRRDVAFIEEVSGEEDGDGDYKENLDYSMSSDDMTYDSDVTATVDGDNDTDEELEVIDLTQSSSTISTYDEIEELEVIDLTCY